MATAVDELLDMLFDMIDEAKNATFSSDKCVIDRDKALDLIEDAKKQLPIDLAEARKILNARNEYLAAAKREADEIRKRAEIEATQMVSEAPVMNQARQKAREILTRADEEAKKTCRETNEYCVDLLRRTEDALAAAHAEMRQVHNQFRSGMGGSSGSERSAGPGGGGRMLTRANLAAVRSEIEYWAGKLAEAEAAEQRGGRNRIFQFVPRDT